MKDEWYITLMLLATAIGIGLGLTGIIETAVSFEGYLDLKHAGAIPQCLLDQLQGQTYTTCAVGLLLGVFLVNQHSLEKGKGKENEE